VASSIAEFAKRVDECTKRAVASQTPPSPVGSINKSSAAVFSFESDQHVKLTGLQRKTEWNGKDATVVKRLHTDGDHYTVRLALDGSDKLIKVKGINLEAVLEGYAPVDETDVKTVSSTAKADHVQSTSPAKDNDESFLSDADGNGSIAEVIGRTLDVCVQAMEDAMVDEIKQNESIGSNESAEKKATYAVMDALSVGSSLASSVTDILKTMEKSDAFHVPESAATGATILKSVQDKGDEEDEDADGIKVEEASVSSWSVVDEDKKQVETDESLARATELVGSFLFNNGISTEEANKDETDASVMSVSSKEPLSPVVLAKWDDELKQLHEIGFLDERKNIDALEHLEASHVGVDSDENVTVNAVVEYLLK
jgi:hypothetical protein